MKQIIFLTLLIAAGTAAFAQERDFPPQPPHYEYTGETFSIDTAFQWPEHCNFTASDYILLNPGFDCKYNMPYYYSNGTSWPNYCTTDFKIDENSVYPPYYGQYGGPNPDDKGCVGAIGGNLDVSSLGGAVYSIPIEVPAGINGMQPNLAITYNSQGGNGLLGWCWDLSGLSSITRTGKTLYHDSEMGGVTLDDENDRFLLDGQRLIEVADYGTQIEYRTEQDGMARIMAYMNESDPSVIDRFIIWQSDGTILEYGYTDDSRIEPQNENTHALCWLLNKVSDRYGNYIKYSYQENSTSYHLETIEYTCNENIVPAFTIFFDYEKDNRKDYEFSYVAGNLITMNKLLEGIRITKNDNPTLVLSHYAFSYSRSPIYAEHPYKEDLLYRHLTSVDLEKNGKKLNPTNITWEWDENETWQHDAFYKKEIDPNDFDNFIFVGDFNADGLSDVITVPYKTDSQYPSDVDMNVFLNTGNADFEHSESLSLTTENDEALYQTLDWIFVTDLNGDGYDDIIVQYIYPNNVAYTLNTCISVYINENGQSFSKVLEKNYGFKAHIEIGDFLGEGKFGAVIFVCVDYDQYSTLNASEYLYSDLGEENCHAVSISDFGCHPAYHAFDAISGDFDGDGHDEIMFVEENTSEIFGMRQDDQSFYFENELEYPEIHYSSNLNLFPGDFNGDGKCDFFCYGAMETTTEPDWYFIFSTGTGIQYMKSYIFCNYREQLEGKLFTHSLERVNCNSGISLSIADFDGDGLSDVAVSLNYNSTIFVYSKIALVTKKYTSPYYGNTYLCYGYNALGEAVKSFVNCRGQYLHAGNFYGKDNMSFFGNEVRAKDGRTVITPMLFGMRSIYEYNSVTCITDGLGNQQRMNYDYLSSVNCHQEKLHDDIWVKPLTIRALNSMTSFNASGNPMTTRYFYHTPLFHKKGHGYLGFQQTIVQNEENGAEVSQTTTTYETTTMGTHAFALPAETKTMVKHNGEWKDSYDKLFTFRKVTSSLDDKIVCPAVMNTTEYYFNIDDPENEPYLHTDYTEYTYSFGDGNTYSNAYNCTNTKHGTDVNLMDNADNCEFVTNETDLFYADKYDTWIINKLHNKVIVQSRRGKPDVEHCWWYEYSSPDSYQIDKIYDIPCRENDRDPMILQTDFEYYLEGNLKKETVSVPHALHGEHSKVTEYEYGPGEGNDCQHRLVRKVTTSSQGLSYETSYLYDDFDNVTEEKGSNGLAVSYSTEPFGITATETKPNGVTSCTALRWVNHGGSEAPDDAYAPETALYYGWSRTSGGLPALVYYGKAGNELRSVSFGLHGEPIITDRLYDDRGRLWKVSNPYRDGDNIQQTEYQYDDIDRLIKTITPDGTETSVAYSGSQTTTTITPTEGDAQQSETTVNAMGWVVRSEDASQSYVTYDHFADGLLASATVNDEPSTTISATYDAARNRSTLTDPNYGTLSTTYNAYGELKKHITPKEATDSKETTFIYDGMGRLIQKTDGMENTETLYTYENNNGVRKGTLSEMRFKERNGSDIQSITYEYDDIARPIKTIEYRASGTYETEMQYDELSRIGRKTFPTGVSVNYDYLHGFLQTISDADGNPLWHTDDFNAFGQLVDATLGSNIFTHRAYDEEMHYIDSIVTSNNLQNLSYEYDKFGNLHARKDNKRNLEETFTYDEQNRLTGIIMNGRTAAMTYDAYGRMTAKQAIVSRNGVPQVSDVFAVSNFDNSRFHAVSKAVAPENVFPQESQLIDYTSFDKVKTIDEGDSHLVYQYGYDQQRIAMTETVGSTTRKKQYAGNCEFVSENGVEKSWTFLSGPYGVFAVVEKKDAEENLHYILKDHLGSWTTVTDAEGNVEQELSFDAWGNLRDPETWTGTGTETPMFDRGYTGHEHITAFGLINMNGRCYDPTMSSFLSVDEYVQDPTSAQSFNRYAYCAYNPLKYTDPTGWYSSYGNPNVAPSINPAGHTTYHCDDPAEALWVRSIHPCETGGSLESTYTITAYIEGNNVKGNWYKDLDGTIKYDKNLETASQLKQGQEFCGVCFEDGGFYYSLFGDKYYTNDISGKIVMKLEREVFPNYFEFAEQRQEFENNWGKNASEYVSEPIEKSTDFSEILEYKMRGSNVYSMKYGDAKLYFYVSMEPEAMKTKLSGWDTTPFSRNSDKTGKHEIGGYDIHFAAWGKDSVRNAPQNGGYFSDVIKLVYPTQSSRTQARKTIYNYYNYHYDYKYYKHK